jgi:predicted amidophosphoribosyltransferase
MIREIPFEEKAICDVCGATGAFDFYGGYLCPKCSQPIQARCYQCGRFVRDDSDWNDFGEIICPRCNNAEIKKENGDESH